MIRRYNYLLFDHLKHLTAAVGPNYFPQKPKKTKVVDVFLVQKAFSTEIVFCVFPTCKIYIPSKNLAFKCLERITRFCNNHEKDTGIHETHHHASM